jgi:ABC-2 type transport system ATP-binding protein
MMNSAAVEVTDLHVVRGGIRAVDGTSFAIPYGQVTGLLGPSGCGKTSLIRALVGVQIVRSTACRRGILT